MTRDLTRLLRPRSIAVVGGGAWCRSVVEQCLKMGFDGPVWPVHPTAETIADIPAVASLNQLPGVPDATFIGVNRHATVGIVRALSDIGAGGAVCFASGFREAVAEDADASDLQDQLLAAAGHMPIFGPNCYGYINYLDGALLWPDQHGGARSEAGVAIVTQSSNIALNLTMQRRALPLAFVVTAGNQAQTGIAAIGAALLADDRVTALGLHIEGVGDLRAFEALAATAQAKGKRIVALKAGRSEQARSAAVSHTASLTGGDIGADCLLHRLGIARADDLLTFLETLKLYHVAGPLPSNRIATLSCSGGEASLAADTAHGRGLTFPPLSERQKDGLGAALGPMVALANPLDYHTYIWRDTPAMTDAFTAMASDDIAMTMVIADFPRADRCDPGDWDCVTDALIAAQAASPGQMGLVATLPEALPEAIADRLVAAGVVPFYGLCEALRACELAAIPAPLPQPPVLLPSPSVTADLIDEATAKTTLAAYGLQIPRAVTTDRAGLPNAATALPYPVVLKGLGLAHKTEAGAVALELTSPDAVIAAASQMPTDTFLIEEMIPHVVAELLIGVLKDPAHGFVLTLAAGGTLAEVLDDSASVLLPTTDTDLNAALDTLRISKVLDGYRGAPAANKDAILAAIRSVEAFVLANAAGLEEIEINPLLCTPTGAVAADALLRRKDV